MHLPNKLGIAYIFRTGFMAAIWCYIVYPCPSMYKWISASVTGEKLSWPWSTK